MSLTVQIYVIFVWTLNVNGDPVHGKFWTMDYCVHLER